MRLAPRGPVGRLLGGYVPAGSRLPHGLVEGQGALPVLLEVLSAAEAAVGGAGLEELFRVGAVLVQPLGLGGVSNAIRGLI